MDTQREAIGFKLEEPFWTQVEVWRVSQVNQPHLSDPTPFSSLYIFFLDTQDVYTKVQFLPFQMTLDF